jgi:hypothetical protein
MRREVVARLWISNGMRIVAPRVILPQRLHPFKSDPLDIIPLVWLTLKSSFTSRPFYWKRVEYE